MPKEQQTSYHKDEEIALSKFLREKVSEVSKTEQEEIDKLGIDSIFYTTNSI